MDISSISILSPLIALQDYHKSFPYYGPISNMIKNIARHSVHTIVSFHGLSLNMESHVYIIAYL